MSAIPLSNIQEIVERSLFQKIREEVVDKGYLPDISNLTLYPDTQVGYDQWESDVLAIKANKGFAIEVFNHGTAESKAIKAFPRIVIQAESFMPGALGGDRTRKYRKVGSNYTPYITPPQTTDYYCNIHIVAGTTAQERILHSLVALALPKRGYIPWYNNATTGESNTLFMENINYYPVDNVDQDLLEKVYVYKVPDCWDMEDEDLPDVISPLKEITVEVDIQTREEVMKDINAMTISITP